MEAASADVSPAPALVAALSYKPGWRFKLAGPGGRFLCVFAETPDSLAPQRTRITQHMFELPAPVMERRAFARWVFECLLKAETHELGEFLAVDGHRPFFPYHQDEGDPYERVERWP